MRPSILILCVLVLILCSCVIVWQKPSTAPGRDADNSIDAPQPAESGPVAGKPAWAPLPKMLSMAATPVEEPAEHAARLQTLAMRGDGDALYKIASALSDPDSEVRSAACAAAIQTGDRSMVPALQAAACREDDIREKAALLAAADFLQLPSLAEARMEN